ncbi:uncharacterized protein FA14DRAFT_172853 [Meira miltonrushii]|uniref:Uncharacterized protein n=1 Tax=Meira miltonrushii TaxID=1280837 RepID=A0A316VJ28_9BASI|nr:uncharacterized protein FA14DRAFT_172853 [Meira miltonrushii]PWN36303.1 hypothetical protein FA14DRAFT_172853 [Meira miltonrushii]
MSSVDARSVGGTPRSSFDAIFDSNSIRSTRRRTSNTWKRVASLYSSPKQKEDDDGPDEDMWDNNDQDFQHQIMIEAKLQSKARIRPSIDEIWLNGATSMEEVASPNELLSPYSHANSQVASSSTPTLLTSFTDSPSFPGTPSWQKPQSSTSNPRPSSTTNASLMTSKSYSTLSSEASTAPTFPSPASSKAELRARQRYSGGNARLAAVFGTPNGGADSRTSMSEDASPVSATFEHASPASKLARNQPSALAPSLSGHLQFGGWTQEQIDSPGAEADRQFGSLVSFPRPGSITEETSPSRYIASATVNDVLNTRTYSQDRLGSPATLQDDELPDVSISNRHRGKALSALLGEPEEVIFATKKLEDAKMLPPLPPNKSKATDYRNSEQGLISGLKKKLLSTRKTGGSPIKNKSSSAASVHQSKATDTIAASNSFPLYTSLSDKDALSEAQAADQNRRPSLPHISTMPVIPARRRFSMQHSPGMHSSFDSKAHNDIQETLADSNSEESTPEPLSLQRKSSMESVISRIPRPSEGRIARSRSRTEAPRSNRDSIVEHVSYEHARSRSSIVSLGITPDMVNDVIPVSPAFYRNATHEDVCEELEGETGSIEEEKNRRVSISSQSSSKASAPRRPSRSDGNGPLHRHPSIDSINPDQRSSLEQSFNSAHSKRWSTVGPAFLTYIDPQKTNAIEANAQNDFRPASPFETIFKGGRRDSEASLSLKKIVSNGNSENADMAARGSISSARDDSLRINAILSPPMAPQTNDDVFGSEAQEKDSPRVKSPVKSTKAWSRRKSFVEPTANRLSNLLKTGIGKKASGLLQSTSPDAKLERSKIKQPERDVDVLDLSLNGWVEDSSGAWTGSRSPATASFTGSSANRSSAGASSLNQKESQSLHQNPIDIPAQGSTEMRSSRSTDLGLERLKTWHNGSSTNLSSSLSSSNNTKRPTFGLDLQPDAASAFDSIPLPETPERSRSRAGSISSSKYGAMSNEHLVLPSPVLFPSRPDGRTSGEEVVLASEPEVYRKASFMSDRRPTLSMPSDLPADVDDVEDLLDDDEEYEDVYDQTLTGDETLTTYDTRRSHVLPSPGMDEVELLEDDEDSKSSHSLDQVGKDVTSNGHTLLSGNENDSKNISSLHTYRFPTGRSSLQDGKSTTSLLIPNKSDNANPPSERISQPLYPLPHPSTNGQNSSPVYKPILASHLRRPSSSASYV